MPLPIAHGLVGAGAVVALHPMATSGKTWKPVLWGALLGICPDLDFVLTWGLGWEKVHRTFSHSLVFAALIAWVMLQVKPKRQRAAVAAYSLAFLSHTLLDFAATSVSEGVALLWPLTTEKYKLGVLSLSEFREGFTSLDVLWASREEVFRAGMIELVIFLPAFLMVCLYRRSRRASFSCEEAA